jgi:hypothetical protein
LLRWTTRASLLPNSSLFHIAKFSPALSNLIFVAASTSTILGLTWGGVTYSWSSYKVLVPLILGIVGIAAFLWVERSFVKHPTVPFQILSHRTSLAGYISTFLHSIVVMAVSASCLALLLSLSCRS